MVGDCGEYLPASDKAYDENPQLRQDVQHARELGAIVSDAELCRPYQPRVVPTAHPQENLLKTIQRVPSFGPNTTL